MSTDVGAWVSDLEIALGTKLLSKESDAVGCPVFWTSADNVVSVLQTLKGFQGRGFEFLSDLTAYDDFGCSEAEKGRFVVVYNLFSPSMKVRLRVKVRVHEATPVPTAISLWKSANWAEREVWDMYGIPFAGHPDLRRILMDERFVGHPQRKDYQWRQYQLFLDAEPMPEHLLKK